jgi:hypothetical protein
MQLVFHETPVDQLTPSNPRTADDRSDGEGATGRMRPIGS